MAANVVNSINFFNVACNKSVGVSSFYKSSTSMKKIALTIYFAIQTVTLFGQSFTARIVDSNNNPIPFATVLTGENSGVISNEEGYFTVYLEDLSAKELEISCLGFTSTKTTIDSIKQANNIIVLKEHINQLDQVYLSNSKPDADAIIAMVNKHLSDNYVNENIKYKIFSRSTSHMDFNKLEFKVTKASGIRKRNLSGVNSGLDSLTNAIANSQSVYFKEYLADLNVWNKENAKLEVIKATQLIDQSKTVSSDEIEEKAQRLILKYLDTTKTYKLKSGLFKIEDSLALNDNSDNKSENKQEYNVEGLRNETHELIHKSQIYDNTLLRKLIDPELYKYTFVDATFYNNELIYVINYEPRRSKAKFTGTLYVADDTYAVVKADYTYAKGKRGEKLNLKMLLGVKFIADLKQGTIMFKKANDGRYQPYYIKEETGNYFYINRPVKFIENSSERNKVAFNFLIEGGQREKQEMFCIDSKTLSQSEFDGLEEQESVAYQRLSKYDASIWKNYNALEPLEEMKTFNAEEN